MTNRVVLVLIITLTSTGAIIGGAKASGDDPLRKTLSSHEASEIFGGNPANNKQCGVDPQCTAPCNINNEVNICVGSTTDPGTCFNETTSTQRQALNQLNCVVDAVGWNCTAGANYVNDSCRVYNACQWDASLQACVIVVPSQPCFNFPQSCADKAP